MPPGSAKTISTIRDPYKSRWICGKFATNSSSTIPNTMPPTTAPAVVPMPPITGMSKIEMLVAKLKTPCGWMNAALPADSTYGSSEG